MLRNKSWLIVLDDVWMVEGVHNLIERLGIPHGTKVVVTTRNIQICNIMGASQIYHMELLSGQDSWNLFCLHAFPDEQQNRPPHELDEVAHQVERECGRLPLAIKTVAASMATQKQLSTWESKLRQLKDVSEPQEPLMRILRLSYDALPTLLKPCFLYFSFFGKDVEIDAEYLICLWIGEGFIPQGKDQWSTGWDYLKQLNSLCLLEVSEDVGVSKNLLSVEDVKLKKTCKIHDMLLDLTIHISRENKCAFTVEEASKASAVGCRRILLAKKRVDDADISQLKCPSSLRTLSLSQNSVTEFPTKSLSRVRALRVIDLSHTQISLLPKCFGKLKLLKVLNLSNKQFTGFKEVPDCVRNLKSLCFLNVDRCPLPKWIGDLQCLQHLHVGRVDYCREISTGVSKLVSLRTLRSEYPLRLFLKDIAKLIQLQQLRIVIENENQGRSLEEGVLAQLVNLRLLTISCSPHVEHQTFPEKMKEMKDLEYLALRGFTVPRWICKYGNLRVLELQCCDWSECPALETLPNLMKLELAGQFEELRESFGKSGAFPQLRSLVVNSFYLEKLPDLQHGAMPRVEVFMVINCFRLQKIPEGFQHLRSLKLLQLQSDNLTEEERKRLKEGGES